MIAPHRTISRSELPQTVSLLDTPPASMTSVPHKRPAWPKTGSAADRATPATWNFPFLDAGRESTRKGVIHL